jgi:hypothetical protein
MKTMGRIKAASTRAKKFIGMKQQRVHDKRWITFNKPKLVGAVITYGKHKIRLTNNLGNNTFNYETIQFHHSPKFK